MRRERFSIWRRISAYIAAHPRRVILFWLVLFGLLVPAAVALQKQLPPSRSIPGTQSADVDRIIAERFGLDTRRSAVLVASGLRPVHDPGDAAILKSMVKAIRAWPQVVRANSVIDIPRDFMVGTDGTGALISVQFVAGARAEELTAQLDALGETTASMAGERDPPFRLDWTGNFFLYADVRAASERGARDGEIMALPLTILLLYAIFGSLRAALSPALSAVVAVGMGIGTVGLSTLVIPWSPSVLIQNVISLTGLALTIDYSLLTLNQFRRATALGATPGQAITIAMEKSAPTIMLAGLSVMLGFGALLMVPTGEIRSIALGGILASAAAAVVSTTLLPALLVHLAPRLIRGWGPIGNGRGREFFGAIARTVCARPLLFLLLAAVPLTTLAMPFRGLTLSAQDIDWLPPDAPSKRGVEALIEAGRWGLANEILVVAEVPAEDHFLTGPGWAAAHGIYARIALTDGVDAVIALPAMMSAKLKPETLQGLPRRTLDPLLSSDNATMLIRVIPDSGLDLAGLTAVVDRLRALAADTAGGAPAPVISVGGMPASRADYITVVWKWMPYVVGLVILGAFMVLAVAFRSPVVAAKAVLLNLFSVGAAFGLATLVFIEGFGGALIGVDAPLEGVFPAMPLIVFCAVFGISMDYEVFLISRIAAARRSEDDETTAIVRGISETGMVITFAAAIMLIVCGSFTAAGFLPAKMLGFTLATAVFLDATIVRILMSPALMRLAGRWNWWPGG